jgi:hypothetical protein
MAENVVRKPPLNWLVGGLLLGLVQVAAIGLAKPLGVSTQFVVANTQLLDAAAPDYVAAHDLIGSDKYRKPGYGWWLDIGIIVGAAVAALATRRWRVHTSTVWWSETRGPGAASRMVACFIGGMFILLGARFAHGCTSGQFASGWAQLTLAAVPFTITLFGFAMLTAMIAYPRTPRIES